MMKASLLHLIQLLIKRAPGIFLVVVAFQRQLGNRPELVCLRGVGNAFQSILGFRFRCSMNLVNVTWGNEPN